jgi:DNA-binding NarL/FixJ family response regulator
MIQQNEILKLAFTSAGLTPCDVYVMYRFMEGLRHHEIASELGMSQQAVSKRIKVCIKKLRNVGASIKYPSDSSTTI